jgi:conjugal transfer/entry exclusion protein
MPVLHATENRYRRYFEQIYADNFNAFNDGSKVEDHWKKAFEEGAKQKELTDLYYQMMMQNTDPDGAAGLATAALMQSVLGAVESVRLLCILKSAMLAFEQSKSYGDALAFNHHQVLAALARSRNILLP